jgi:serine/threonine protein kinase
VRPGPDSVVSSGPGAVAPPGFKIVGTLGSGGFATVYRAWQETLEREVALKVFNVRLTDERQAIRFRSECAAVGRLDGHPHVVLVHEAQAPLADNPYISMRLYRGGDLAARTAAGPLALEQVLSYGVLLASALEHAHRHGVIHRDLKPQNVLIGDDGLPVLADFGVAVVIGQAEAEARSQAFSLAHVSPEVLNGGTADERSDIYGLASTLYAVAAGRPPFPGTAVGPLAAAILTSAPPPLKGEAAAISELLLQALAKNPLDRPAGAAEFGAALQSLQAELGLPVTATRPVGPDNTRDADSGARRSRDSWTTSSSVPSTGSPFAAPSTGDEPTRVRVRARDHTPDPLSVGELPTRIRRQEQPASVRSTGALRRTVWSVAGGLVLLFLLGGVWAVVDARSRGSAPPTASPPTVDARPATSQASASTATLGLDNSLPAPRNVRANATTGGLQVVWQAPVTTDAYLIRVVVDGRPTVVDAARTSFESPGAAPAATVCVEAVYLGVGRSSCTAAS